MVQVVLVAQVVKVVREVLVAQVVLEVPAEQAAQAV